MAYLFYDKDVTDMSIREINKLSRQYRIVHNEVIAERDMTYYTHSTEVSEAEFMAELSKK